MWSSRYCPAARLSLLVLTASTVSMGSAPSQYGYISFQLDCTRSDFDNTKTSDALTVEFYSEGSFVGAQTSWPHCGKTTDAFYGVRVLNEDVRDNIDYVIVKTNGDDALYIDEAYMGWAMSDGKIPHMPHWGIAAHLDSSVLGWCLSQDSDDAVDWSTSVMGGRCYSCLKFDTHGETTSYSFDTPDYLDERAVSSCE